jgi:xylose dehydrogenase (NAD/NADP)
MNEPIRFGILGAGRVARDHFAPALHRSEIAELYAAASRDRSRALALSPIVAYASYQELLNDPAVEVVYIATHNGLHRELAVNAMTNGKHVLCEKPLGCNQEECRAMLSCAQSTGRLLMEGFMYRYHPQIDILLDIAQAGTIGELTTVEASFRFHMTGSDDIRLHQDWGGGALLDVGPYCVNISRLFFGDHPVAARALAVFHPERGVDISTSGTLLYSSGKTSVISCGFDGGFHQKVVLVGTRGRATLNEPFIYTTGCPQLTVEVGSTRQIYDMENVNCFELELNDFVRAMRKGGVTLLPPEEGLLNAQVLDLLRGALNGS